MEISCSFPLSLFLTVGVISSCWGLLYFAVHSYLRRRLDKQILHGVSCRLVSILHAFLAVIVSTYTLQERLSLGSPLCDMRQNFESEQSVIIAAFGYFLYDTLLCNVGGLEGFEYVLHHLTCLTAFLTGIVCHIHGDLLSLAYLVCEMSNPCLHMIGILDILNASPLWPRLSAISKGCFGVLFIVGRAMVLPYILYTAIFYCGVNFGYGSFVIQVMALTLQTLSFYWLYVIIQTARGKIKPKNY